MSTLNSRIPHTSSDLLSLNPLPLDAFGQWDDFPTRVGLLHSYSRLSIQHPLHHLCNRQTASQPGALDAEQVHEALEAVLLPDDEIDKVLPRRHRTRLSQLGPDAGVIGRDGLGVDVGQELLDLLDCLAQTMRRDGKVVGRVDPLDVWAEADPASDVEGEMRAEAAEARLWCGVDEVLCAGSGGGVGEVVAFGVVGSHVARFGKEHVVDGTSAQTSAVDERLGCEAAFLVRAPILAVDRVAVG